MVDEGRRGGGESIAIDLRLCGSLHFAERQLLSVSKATILRQVS